jgi:type IV pilus assembly protein PilB
MSFGEDQVHSGGNGTTTVNRGPAWPGTTIWTSPFNLRTVRADGAYMGDAAAGRLLASDHNLEFVDLDRYSVDASAGRLLPVSVARRHHVVPIGRKFGAPVVAIADPNDVVALDTLRATMGREFVAVVAPDDQIEACLDRVYKTDFQAAPTSSAPGGSSTATSGSAVNGAGSPTVKPPHEDGLSEMDLGPEAVALAGEPDQQDSAPVWEPPFDTVFDAEPASHQPNTDEVTEPSGAMGTGQTSGGGGPVPASLAPTESHAVPSETVQTEAGAPDELLHFPPLARVLVEGGRVDLATMREVLAERDRSGQAVARILTVRGLVGESDLMWGMAQEMGLEFVDLDLQSTDFAAAYHLPEATARHHNVLVIGNRDGVPLVAASNPTDVFAMDDLRTIIGRNFITVVATRSQITTYIDRAYHQGGDASEVAQSVASDFDDNLDEDLGNLQAVVDDAPIVRYVNLLVLQALNERASDIHVEPTGENLRIRYRIDGVLHDISTAPRAIAAAVTTRLKVMSDMNIAEHRLPQDGRISLTVGSRSIDLRIATLPTIYGEKVVMRVLDKSNIVLGFEDLGFDNDLLEIYRGIFTKPYGTILVTGPTGSGKTTTLYATLAALNSPDKNIITVEDPVELRLKGINQVQLNIKAGLNFATALKSILRSDPDIVLVGEIRDRETAMISIEAALTGHLVLATLHTNDSASTPMRLVEMGMEPFLVTSAMTAALAQRLARRLCVHCREAFEPTEAEIVAAGWTPEELFADHPHPVLHRAIGCSACSTTGYLGRKALLELLVVTEGIEHLIIEGGTADDIHRLAVEQGMVTLRQSGLRKALEGETTLEEVLRVVA